MITSLEASPLRVARVGDVPYQAIVLQCLFGAFALCLWLIFKRVDMRARVRRVAAPRAA